MSSPLAELAALLASKSPVTGIVIALRGESADIATPSGMVQARAGRGVTVGARVRVVDGVARPAVTPTGAYPV